MQKKLIYPWIVVLCCCAMATASIGIAINCMGVYYAPIAVELGVGLGSVSFYLTILNLTAGFFGPVVIKLTKKLDVRLLIGVGGFGSALCYVLLANVTALWQLYVLALVQGMLLSMCGMVLVTTLVSNWFSKAMGVATGLSLSFSGLMGAVLSPVFHSIIESQGWRTSYYIAAILVACCILPAVIFVRLHPSHIGLPQFGSDEVKDPVRVAAKEKDSAALKTLPFALMVVVGFCASFITGMGSHISNYAASVGISASVGALMISAVMVGNMTGKLASGVLCDLLKPKRAVILFFGIVVLGCVLLLVPGLGTGAAMVGSVCLGCSYCIPGVGLSTISREVFGGEKFSAAYSYVTMAGFIGSACAFAAIGYSYDLSGSFVPAVAFCIAIAAVSAGCILAAYRRKG